MELKMVVWGAERVFEEQEVGVEEVERSDKEVERDIEVGIDVEEMIRIIRDTDRPKKEFREAVRDVLEEKRDPMEMMLDAAEKLTREVEETKDYCLLLEKEFDEAERDTKEAIRELEKVARGLPESFMKPHPQRVNSRCS